MMLRAWILLWLTPIAALAQLEGVVDLHVHCAPDSVSRSIDALETARMARRHGMRALLFKNHYTHTASLAYLVSQAVPEVESYGGIVLNAAVGGINPIAVEHMARTTGRFGRVVWMPTFDSEHYHRTWKPNPNYVPVAQNGELLASVKEVLRVMALEGLALATGHSSPDESLLLIQEARKLGIDRIIVTHPANPLVSMSVAKQKEAARLGAFLEYPFQVILPNGDLKIEDYVKSIRAVGVEHCILTSDLGLPMDPVHTDGWVTFFQQLRESGFTQAEIDRMSQQNPAQFLGLSGKSLR